MHSLCPANRPFRSSTTWLRRGPAAPVARRSVCNNAIANSADLRSPTAAAAAPNRPASRRLFCCQLEVLAQRIRSISSDHSSVFLFPPVSFLLLLFLFAFSSVELSGKKTVLRLVAGRGRRAPALLCVVIREYLAGEVSNYGGRCLLICGTDVVFIQFRNMGLWGSSFKGEWECKGTSFKCK